MTWLTAFSNLFIVLVMVYFITCICYLLLHRYFIIFPSRRLSLTPQDYLLEHEDVYFNTVDKVLLNGWYIKGDQAGEWKDFTIVLFPGNKGTMSDFLVQTKNLSKAGFNVFLFGYRGFGKSRGILPTEKGVYKDSEAACEYLTGKRHIRMKNIIFLGQSLGCAMAACTAVKFNPRALILEGGFPSIADVAARAVKWLPLKLLTRSRFDTKKFLEKIKCPVLIIHSRDDKAIPLSDADVLFGAVKVKKKKAVVSGPHVKGLEYDSEAYLMEMIDFLHSTGQ